jgi:hypothetical protein
MRPRSRGCALGCALWLCAVVVRCGCAQFCCTTALLNLICLCSCCRFAFFGACGGLFVSCLACALAFDCASFGACGALFVSSLACAAAFVSCFLAPAAGCLFPVLPVLVFLCSVFRRLRRAVCFLSCLCSPCCVASFGACGGLFVSCLACALALFVLFGACGGLFVSCLACALPVVLRLSAPAAGCSFPLLLVLLFVLCFLAPATGCLFPCLACARVFVLCFSAPAAGCLFPVLLVLLLSFCVFRRLRWAVCFLSCLCSCFCFVLFGACGGLFVSCLACALVRCPLNSYAPAFSRLCAGLCAVVVGCGCVQFCCTTAMLNLICLCALCCIRFSRMSHSDFCEA